MTYWAFHSSIWVLWQTKECGLAFITAANFAARSWIDLNLPHWNRFTEDQNLYIFLRMGVEKIPWETKLAILQRYKETQGTAVVPTRYIDPDSGFRLGGWVHHLRQTRSKLTPEQVQILEDIGFVWNASKERPWEIKLAALRRFYEQHHHFRVPRFHVDEVSGFKLGQWIPSLRRKDAALKPSRRRDLERLGFFAPESSSHQETQQQQQEDSDFLTDPSASQTMEFASPIPSQLESLYQNSNLNHPGATWSDYGLTTSSLSPFAAAGGLSNASSTTTATTATSTTCSTTEVPSLSLLSQHQQQQQQQGELDSSSVFLPTSLVDDSSSQPQHKPYAPLSLVSSALPPSQPANRSPPFHRATNATTTTTTSRSLYHPHNTSVRATVAQGMAFMRQPLEQLKTQSSSVPTAAGVATNATSDPHVQVIEL